MALRRRAFESEPSRSRPHERFGAYALPALQSVGYGYLAGSYPHVALLTGELEVGRVIARPFVGDHAGAFKRTGARRDFSAQPPQTMCDILKENGKTVYGVGKIEDIFDHRGITKSQSLIHIRRCRRAN